MWYHVRNSMSQQKYVNLVAVAVVAASTILFTQSSLAQSDKTENWLGTLDVQVAKLRIQLELQVDENGNYSGDMISLDQGSSRIKLTRVVRTQDKLEFEIQTPATKFEGTLNDDQSIATGKFIQGRPFDLTFHRVADVKPDKHIQSWKGTLVAGAQEFDFQFRIFESGEGNLLAKLDSFTEKLAGIQCEVDVTENEISFAVPATAAKLVGTLSEDKQTIEGNWIQGGGKFPITLKKIPLEQTRRLDLKRPQTPKPPFEYVVSDFVVPVKEFDSSYPEPFEIAGTLTHPKGDGPFATVILISGSGPQDRDETIFEHKPFLVIADHLTKQGFAVIRYDDRGVAKSTGDFANATSVDLAQDAATLIAWAKAQPSLDAERIILAGHSEGGLIAPMVASRNRDVAGVILLAGPGVSGASIIQNQSRKIAAVAGTTEDILEMQEKMLGKLFDRIESGKPFDEAFRESLASEFDGLPAEESEAFASHGVVEKALMTMDSPWMRFFLTYDPQAALSKTTCPILSVIGENDLQVDPKLNLPAIEAAVKAGGNQDFVQKELPQLNHLFQPSETGAPSEYIRIEQTLDPLLLDEITTWLKKRF